jgi:hypothetical protein
MERTRTRFFDTTARQDLALHFSAPDAQIPQGNTPPGRMTMRSHDLPALLRREGRVWLGARACGVVLFLIF